MVRALVCMMTVGAAALVAAALLRPVSDVADRAAVDRDPGIETPVRLVGRAPRPFPPPGADLATALDAARSEDEPARLEHWAAHARDARVRRAAIRRLVELQGPAARAFLLRRLADTAEAVRVRAACARLLGRIGSVADLEGILDGSLPPGVRAGAAAGLVDVGCDAVAGSRIDTVLHGDEHALRQAVVASLVEARTAWSHRLAVRYVEDPTLPPEARARLARGLGAQRVEAARPALEVVLAAEAEPPAVRAAAAEALGVLGNPEARGALAALARDAPRALRNAATIALQRLDRRASEAR